MNIILVRAYIKENHEKELKRILAHTADYCEKVKNMALHYVCKEKILNKKYFYRVKEVLERVPGTSTTVITNKLELKDYEEETVRLPTKEYKKTIIWNVDYEIEEKGVRFPSKQVVHEIFINEKNEKIIQEEITFLYTDYKFFIVETDVKYKLK
jgi:hypothetical protein